jgi:hypothetical protein
MENQKLPALKDLYAGKVQLAKENDLNILLNQEPKKEWIKAHPMASGVSYIPIEVIEYLLTTIFVVWRVEIKDIQVIANSVVVTIRLHYQAPVTGDMRWTDGIGAAPMQTAKDAAATDFSQIKSDAVMKAAPAAESYAIKDAAEKLGKLFGKDMNRKDALGYSALGNKFDMATPDQMNYIEILKGQTTLTDQLMSDLDFELFEGVSEERAKEIIINLEMNRNNTEPDLTTQKGINKTLDFKIKEDD